MDIQMKNVHERELHPFLNRYLRSHLGIAAKTIYQEKSLNSLKGENEWVHPDMVAFNLPTSSWNEKVVNMCDHYHIPKVILYSYEIKKEITMSSLREDYFQAVSNSSWANEGYLVAANINTNDEKLMQKMSRLCTSFGIGIIHLNIGQCEKSNILFEARRKEVIDGETVNHLFEINQDFKSFIKTVENSLKINSMVYSELDDLKSKRELEEIIAATDINKTAAPKNEIHTVDNDALIQFDWSSPPTGKKVHSFSISNQTIPVSSWKELYLGICNHLIETDKEKFMLATTLVKGKKRLYFSRNEEDFRIPYYLEKSGHYIEVNLSAQLIVSILKSLIKQMAYKDKITIFLEKNND